MPIASNHLHRLASAVLATAALSVIPFALPGVADAKPTKSMLFGACMQSDNNYDRDAVLKKCCDLIGGEVITFPDGGKGCAHAPGESTQPKAPNPVVPVEPPTIGDPPTTAITPIVPVQSPVIR